MKSPSLSIILGVLLCSLVNYSGAYTGEDAIDLKDPNQNGIEQGNFGGGSGELMPGRDLSTQELKNLIYITMQEYFENRKKSEPQGDSGLSDLEDSVKVLLRPKRFIFTRMARNGNNVNGGGGPIANFWQRWAQRRLQRIERRRQRWQNFRQRQQTFFQNMRTPQISAGTPVVGAPNVAGTGHRIVMSSRVPPATLALGQTSTTVQNPSTKTT